MIYNNNNKPRYFYFLITMAIDFDTQIDTRKGEQSDTNWNGICIYMGINLSTSRFYMLLITYLGSYKVFF
jgi:hypothetical protein